jgi:spore maturation protein CgeB
VRIAWFGSSLVSAYWNGAATYYRGLIRALYRHGHRVTFFEPHAYGRQENRDIADPFWADVVIYRPDAWPEALECARGADVVVKASGVGVNDAELEAGVLALGAPVVLFWDVDAPATLARLEADPADPLRGLVGRYDAVLTYGGGRPVVDRYLTLGARECVPVYNALDPGTHHPVLPDPRFEADLAFLGNRLPDREERVEDFFLQAARRAPGKRFLLGGAGWDARELPPNVTHVGHVSTNDHNALNSTPLAVLNVLRESMATNGWSPATRIFEAAGAAACVVTDAWDGIEEFLEPGAEVLVADGGQDVAAHVDALTPERARQIGARARERVLAEHTYERRAAQVEELLGVRV